jgi:hypothetical protein
LLIAEYRRRRSWRRPRIIDIERIHGTNRNLSNPAWTYETSALIWRIERQSEGWFLFMGRQKVGPCLTPYQALDWVAVLKRAECDAEVPSVPPLNLSKWERRSDPQDN